MALYSIHSYNDRISSKSSISPNPSAGSLIGRRPGVAECFGMRVSLPTLFDPLLLRQRPRTSDSTSQRKADSPWPPCANLRAHENLLLNASSASIQFAATEPDARTNCRTSSDIAEVRGNPSSSNAKTSLFKSRGLGEPSSKSLWIFEFEYYLGFGFWALELAAATDFLRGVGQIVRRNHSQTGLSD